MYVDLYINAGITALFNGDVAEYNFMGGVLSDYLSALEKLGDVSADFVTETMNYYKNLNTV